MSKSDFDYKTKKAQLEAIVEWFEVGDLDFEKASQKFQEAKKITKELEDYLESKKAEISVEKK